MSSGVAVNDQVVTEYNNIKIGHKYAWVIYKISDGLKEVVVDHTQEDLSATYDDFTSVFTDDDCRYAVYDCKYTLKDGGERQKLVFIVWCPDTAPVKKKMVYASSKDALRKKLVGVGNEIQATARDELEWDVILDKISRGGTS